MRSDTCCSHAHPLHTARTALSPLIKCHRRRPCSPGLFTALTLDVCPRSCAVCAQYRSSPSSRAPPTVRASSASRWLDDRRLRPPRGHCVATACRNWRRQRSSFGGVMATQEHGSLHQAAKLPDMGAKDKLRVAFSCWTTAFCQSPRRLCKPEKVAHVPRCDTVVASVPWVHVAFRAPLGRAKPPAAHRMSSVRRRRLQRKSSAAPLLCSALAGSTQSTRRRLTSLTDKVRPFFHRTLSVVTEKRVVPCR